MTSYSDAELLKLTQELADCLRSLNYKLASAESCTGGWLAKCCTDLDGSSRWFDQGLITYSNQAKKQLLDVKAKTLLQYGAVSENTALEMAQGALDNTEANIAISITGIAGPTGGSDQKPVGTVCFGLALDQQAPLTEQHHFPGNRDAVRRQAVAMAMTLIIKNARAVSESVG